MSVLEVVTPSNNLTDQQKDQLLLYDILIPTLGVAIIVLNFFVVVSSGLILKKGQQPKSTYLFLGNVAMCDLVTGIAVLFGQFYPKNYRDQSTCAFQLGLIVSSTLASIYSVALIAIDRYLYIIHGLQYQKWIYPTRARLYIFFTWIIGCVVGFLPIMGWSGDTLNGKICWFIKLVPSKLIVMTCVLGMFPIIIVFVLYSIILYHALKKVIQLRKKNNFKISDTIDNRNIFKRLFIKKQITKVPSKSKAIIVVVLVTGSFVITWVPYFTAGFLYTLCDQKETPVKCKNLQVLIASPFAILGFCNSLLNPVIYAWWHNGFRTSIKRIFKKNKISIEQSSTKSSISINKKKSIDQTNSNMQTVDIYM